MHRCLMALFAGLLIIAPAAAQAPDSTSRDYKNELPRVAPTKAADATKTIKVAPGFRVQQVAAEPLVADPIAMAFDESGRLFVVEMRGYPESRNENLGQIRRLVDVDGDGRFDKSTVYVDGLSWPTAVACYDGGVLVAAAPDIFYCKDTDGDGKADIKRCVFTGFGIGNVQGLLNTFKWGLDNRIHGATSSNGGSILHVTEKSRKPISLRGRDFAIEPRTMRLAPTSGGGQHGLSFDRWGRKFVCSNSNHIQLVMFEDRYLARNKYLAAGSSRTSIAADGPQADVFRLSPVEPWRIVRTRLRKKGIVPGPVERGGKAAGYFTGSTGITIYRGDAWPAKYLGWALVGDVGSNLLHRKRLEPAGVGLIARRVDEKSEFVASTDIWFRPAQFCNAPDGTLYIADMYREVIEHPASLHPVIKKHLDLTSGRGRGRIYRVVPEGFHHRKPPRLGAANIEQLVATLNHANGWHRQTAARLIYERQDRRAIGPLEKLSAGASRPEGRMRALYALDGLGALVGEVILPRLSDPHARVRQHAVRLSERVLDDPTVRSKLVSMTGDDDLRVRYQLAFTLGELRTAAAHSALATILQRDGGDRWMRLAAFSSLADGGGEVFARLAALPAYRNTPQGRGQLQSLAKQIGKRNRRSEVAAVLKALQLLPEKENSLARAIVVGLTQGAGKNGAALQKQLAGSAGSKAAAVLRELLAAAQKTALDEKQSTDVRAEAIRSLGLGSFGAARDVLAKSLDLRQPQPVRQAAIDTLGRFDNASAAALVIDAWPALGPQSRRRAEEMLFSRSVYVAALLEAIAAKKIRIGEVAAARFTLLRSHPDREIREAAARLAKQSQQTGRGKIVQAYRSALSLKGDPTRGQAVFKKTCAACHKIGEVGHAIGPNLLTLRNRGAESILLNVLDPNREVNPQYLNYVAITTDGRTLTGMITAETATSLTLTRGDNARDTLLRVDVEALKSSGQSLMPEGMEKDINQAAMADLIAYLLSLE